MSSKNLGDRSFRDPKNFGDGGNEDVISHIRASGEQSQESAGWIEGQCGTNGQVGNYPGVSRQDTLLEMIN